MLNHGAVHGEWWFVPLQFPPRINHNETCWCVAVCYYRKLLMILQFSTFQQITNYKTGASSF